MKIGASYSTICQDELLSKLVPQYLVDKPEACRFWERGINDTYEVVCIDAKYSLRVYRHNLRSREAIDFEIAALLYLNDHGANVAYPVEKREGGYVTELHSPEGVRYAIMTTYAHGMEPDYSHVESGRLFGASVAELHNISDSFTTEYSRPRLELDHLLDKSLEVIVPFCNNMTENRQFLEEIAAELRSTVVNKPSGKLDVGFCHGDCHGCNVHNSNGSLIHFDFDCCGFGFRVFELATFKWGIFGDDNEEELWTSFLEGYRSNRIVNHEDLILVNSFVVIRQIWWMALIMGNASDFGYSATSDGFITHHVKKIQKLLAKVPLNQV